MPGCDTKSSYDDDAKSGYDTSFVGSGRSNGAACACRGGYDAKSGTKSSYDTTSGYDAKSGYDTSLVGRGRSNNRRRFRLLAHGGGR